MCNKVQKQSFTDVLNRSELHPEEQEMLSINCSGFFIDEHVHNWVGCLH